MSMYDKNHYNIVIRLQLIKISGKKKEKVVHFQFQLLMLVTNLYQLTYHK